jgi:hypothetical protein
MLLGPLGVLLGGPWGPKNIKANQTAKLRKNAKNDNRENSRKHYVQRLKRFFDNREITVHD